ncbi:MAG: hypothetical protein NT154_02530 [Verrucomicrobia bacterium]|nr:hypothetical protein [Verrucomicrobiota bacterium]
MNGVLVAWGRGIKPGSKLGLVDNIDVAPTIAALLGRSLPGADGRVLREIMSNPKRETPVGLAGRSGAELEE